MAKIELKTIINAPIERVFDLARSIDLHISSTTITNEKTIAGKVSGLIELGETVTWRAKHLGIYQNLTVEIIKFDKPNMFCDKMLKGAFKSMQHIHKFKSYSNGTIMIDEFEFKTPFGILGKLIEFLFLKSYMTKFLLNKNNQLKQAAEGEKWQQILNKNI